MKEVRFQKKGIVIELTPDPEQGGFTAEIPNIPAYGEGETEEEAINDLKEALVGFIEAFGIEEAQRYVSTSPPTIRLVDAELSEFAGLF